MPVSREYFDYLIDQLNPGVSAFPAATRLSSPKSFCGVSERLGCAIYPEERSSMHSASGSFKAFGPVTAKRMFGGAGLYHHGVFFGLVADDVLYFKVDDANKTEYEAAGSGPFRPFGSSAMSYYEVPGDVLQDNDRLQEWAIKAISAAGKRTPSARNRTSCGRR